MEKYKFDFSKPEDQEVVKKLNPEEKKNIKDEARDEADMIRVLVLDFKKQKGETGDPTAEEYKEAENFIETAKSENDIEQLDKICEVVAREHIFNLENWKKSYPTRLAYSGFLEETYDKGFKNQSFYWEKIQRGFDWSDFKHCTRNDAFNDLYGDWISAGFKGHPQGFPRSMISGLNLKRNTHYVEKTDRVEMYNFETKIATTNLEYQENIKNDFPEAYEGFCKKIEGLKNKMAETKENPDRYRWAKEDLENAFFDIEEYSEFLNKYTTEDDTKNNRIHKIITNILAGLDLDKWEFAEQDLAYRSIVNHCFDEFKGKKVAGGCQLYDMAYVVDKEKIEDYKNGYLPGEEIEVTGKPRCIKGMVINAGPVEMESYYIEKAKRIFRKNPDLSRPLYDRRANLIWPERKTTKELDEEMPQGEFDKQEITWWR